MIIIIHNLLSSINNMDTSNLYNHGVALFDTM
jgi:hypothetical protein